MSLLSVFIILVVLTAIFYFCVYLSVCAKNNAAIEAFKSLDMVLKTRYGLILDIINTVKHDDDLVDEITRLRTEVILLGVKRENIDRRIAFDTELARLMTTVLNEKISPDAETLKNEYESNREIVLKSVENYNKKAAALKRAVACFPESFVCRINRIFALDLFRI